ncbi:MAG: MarR family winged helix-turn-helix transcriptional regulator [Cyanobacteriota bacterium]|nr:MarR family winged helix-turn-helix transcriptional regulator [Cyanobacteriota bacterium]
MSELSASIVPLSDLPLPSAVEPWREVLAPQSLGYRLTLLSQLIRRQLQNLLDDYGMTTFHWVVLCCLWEEDGVATSAICQRLQQLGGTMTGVLDGMEKRGLIRRQRDPLDRRIWRVYLTEVGEALRTILPPKVKQLREETYGCLLPEEQKQLSQFVDILIAHLS